MTRGEIWLVEFEPAVGAEIRKTRPALIISRDAYGVLPLRIVVPVTGWQPAFERFPWMVRVEPSAVNGLSKSSAFDGLQAKLLSTRRFQRRMGSVPDDLVGHVVRAVGLMIGHS